MFKLILSKSIFTFLFCSNFLKCLSDKGSGFFGTSNYQEPEDEVIKRIGEVADGVFQVSDLHESGGKIFSVSNKGLKLVCKRGKNYLFYEH